MRAAPYFTRWWWEEDTANLNGWDLTPVDFNNFFKVVDSLELSGEAHRGLAKILVNKGLLGPHSAEILDNFMYDCTTGRSVVREMLLVFAAQVGLILEVVDDFLVFYPVGNENSARQASIFAVIWAVNSSEDIVVVRRAVLLDLLPDQKPRYFDLSAVLGWLLCHIGVFSLTISFELYYSRRQLPAPPVPGFVAMLSQSLFAMTRPHGGRRVVVHILNLLDCQLGFASVTALMLECPSLRDLRVSIHEQLAEHDLEIFKAFPEIDTLWLLGAVQKTTLIKHLTDRLPNLTKLEIQLDRHVDDITPDFLGQSALEEVVFHGEGQRSSSFWLGSTIAPLQSASPTVHSSRRWVPGERTPPSPWY